MQYVLIFLDFFLFFFIQDKNSLLFNLCVYVCETSFWKLKPQPLPPSPNALQTLILMKWSSRKRWWLIFLVLIDVQLSILCINVETHCYVSCVVVTKYKTNTSFLSLFLYTNTLSLLLSEIYFLWTVSLFVEQSQNQAFSCEVPIKFKMSISFFFFLWLFSC